MTFAHVAPRPVVLFDLDGTLLPMDMDTFIRAYFQTLCPLVPEVAPDLLARAVLGGTRAMAENDGGRTNREVFAAFLQKACGVDFYANEDRFLRYYREEFQDCVQVCRPTALSREIVACLKEKGYRVAVATNPIFPEVATVSRLRWLGMEASSFELVTTYEDFRHAKPNLQYYRDVCRRLAVRPEDCVMVGNDVEEDGCAARLGMAVLLVSDCLLNARNLPTASFPMGSLADVLAWAAALPRRV